MTIIQGNFGRQPKRVSSNEKEKKQAPLYQLHVSLSFSEPLIWRRIEVSGEVNLKQFHEILQICMGWSGEYSHLFYVGKVFYEMSSPTGDEKKYDEEKFDLQTLEEAMRWCFTYLYDADEGWEHNIVLEEIKPAQKGQTYPVVLDGEQSSPPENIGGVHRYGEILHAIQNPADEKSSEILSCYELSNFDPGYFDQEKINGLLQKGVWREG